MYTVTPAAEASMMSVGPKIFDLGKNGLQLTDDSVTRLKKIICYETIRMSFSHTFHFRTTTRRDLTKCVHSKKRERERARSSSLLTTRHTQRWAERKVDPMLCKGDLAFFCNCPVTVDKLVSVGARAHSWHFTKRGRSGNSRICGRSRSDR